MGHYLIQPLAERGVACLSLNSRYVGNDTLLRMERVIQDLGASVKCEIPAQPRLRQGGTDRREMDCGAGPERYASVRA